MPNIITHTIFCEEALKKITNKKYKNIIENNLCEYKIGTNGPDFLFFYAAFPLHKKKDLVIPNIGTSFHRKNINAFYKYALEAYHQESNNDIKEAMASYIIGHYLHWQLDSIMHPYVVYRTGFKDKLSKYYHHRFESMMDTIMLDRFRNTTIKQFKTFKICWQSSNSVKAISNVYIPCIKKCQNIDVDQSIISQALNDWETAQRYLYDPTGIKYHLLKIYEFIIHKPWLYSGNIVRVINDHKYDIMNDNHKLWLNPCNEWKSKESVTDLFDHSLYNAQIGLPLLFDCLDGNDIKPLLDFIDDKSYSNGVKGNLERKFKSVIYNKSDKK